MERFRLSAGDRGTFFSIESAGRTIYTLPAHPLILFRARLSLSLFLISRLVSRSTNWDQSIFANSKYGNQMSQFPGIRGKLGLNRRSSNMFLIGFHLDTCHWSGLGYSRKYFISFEVNIHSVNDVMYDNLEKLLLFCLLENISSYAEVYNNCVTLYLIYI